MDGIARGMEATTDSSWCLFDSVGSGIAVTRPDGTLAYCNTALLELAARQAATLLGSSIFDLLHGASSGDLRHLHHAALAGHTEQRTEVQGNGGNFVAGVILRRLDRDDGPRVIWTFVDIRGNDPVIERSKSRFANAVWGASVGFWDIDVATDAVHWWNDWCATVDLDPRNGTNHALRWSEDVHPDDDPPFAHVYNEVIEGRREIYEAEYRIRTRSGAWRWILSRGCATARDSAGRAVRLAGVTIDIDARKRAELALRESEERYELAVNAAQLPVWELDVRTDVFKGNVYWHKAVGYELTEPQARERVETWLSDVHPEDAPKHACAWLDHTVDKKGFHETEFRIKTAAGGYKWLLDRGRVVERDAQGLPLRVVGIALDIDSRKRIELALRDSEARLETAIWGADLGLWDWKPEDDSLLWLSDWPFRYGIDAKQRIIRRQQWLARVHPGDLRKYAADDLLLTHEGHNCAESDYRILSSQGDWRWVNVRTRVIERDCAGRPLRIVGACIEVDSRRRAEQLLRTQAIILETMREGVVLAGRNGRIEFTNPAFDRMFGRRSDELLGTSIMDLLNAKQKVQSPPPAAEGLLAQYNGRSPRRDMQFRRTDGSQFAGEALSAQIELSGENKILVVVQDVSERKQLESEIIEIANRERRRLAGDLHDGLGQELTGISLMLRSLAKRTAVTVPNSAPELNEIIALVNHAIQSTRKMALGISPVTLQRGGLLSALETLTGWSRDSYGIDVRLRLMVRWPLLIDESTATHLYLIAQEAINNAAKHGRARSVAVALRINRTLVYLSITDDGVGMTEAAPRGAGMGLKIMQYRSTMIGGAVRFESPAAGGTRIRCICPHRAGSLNPKSILPL
jgi:PAS domain S-box-containing protein